MLSNDELQRLWPAERISILETHRNKMIDELNNTLFRLDENCELAKKYEAIDKMFLDLIKAEAEYLASL